jgi:hypothetical protein
MAGREDLQQSGLHIRRLKTSTSIGLLEGSRERTMLNFNRRRWPCSLAERIQAIVPSASFYAMDLTPAMLLSLSKKNVGISTRAS